MAKRKQTLDKEGARATFNLAVEHVARLAIVAKSAHASICWSGPVCAQIESHTRNDIVLAALSLRRLADLTNTIKQLNDFKIAEARPAKKRLNELIFYRTKTHHSFSTVIGTIIHYRTMKLLDNEYLLFQNALPSNIGWGT